MMGPAFVTRVVEDLRAFSSPLLEPGAAPRAAGEVQAGRSALEALHGLVAALSAMLPRLVAEATREDRAVRRHVQRSAAIPRRARASRAPWDFELHDGRLLPTTWLAVEPLPAPAPAAVAWLRHLATQLGANVARGARHVDVHLDDAISMRSDRSSYARAERERLHALRRGIEASRAALARAQRALASHAPVGARPRGMEPRPYPATATWQRLRALARRIEDPAVLLPAWWSSALDAPAGAIDLPFLYQRWCGVQLVRALGELGFRPRSDPTGPLLLGELAIELVDAEHRVVTLWCEPRFVRGEHHPSNLVPARDFEQQPDFVLLASGERGLDAYVLDATLSTDDDRLREKSRYRSSLRFAAPRLVAGIPVVARPDRSWALAPLDAPLCRLHDDEGRCGVIPLHPEHPGRALSAWLGDIVARGRRWAPDLA
ncbi:MAG: hypothetical protein R3F05_16030 [Planctomycetota bacterium]|nr:hypothetical protein [Planctomycetota bacterium]MCB9825994.1 hypothetical protein [Planctomycetota bacterium]MCB9901609.1 hypothetical protein [Planctomycetota bacterium]